MRIGFEANTTPLRSRHQYEVCMDDREVLFDVLRLVLAYLDRDVGSMSGPEKDRCETFLRSFASAIFCISAEELDEALGVSVAQPDSAGSSNGVNATAAEGRDSPAPVANDDESEADPDEEGARTGRAGQISDLRRHLLATASATGLGGSRAASPSTTDGGQVAPNGAVAPLNDERLAELGHERTWIRAQREPWEDTGAPPSSHPMRARRSSEDGSAASDTASRPISRRYNFFCGTNHYTLVRLLHVRSRLV
jgi:hypothetical protein